MSYVSTLKGFLPARTAQHAHVQAQALAETRALTERAQRASREVAALSRRVDEIADTVRMHTAAMDVTSRHTAHCEAQDGEGMRRI